MELWLIQFSSPRSLQCFDQLLLQITNIGIFLWIVFKMNRKRRTILWRSNRYQRCCAKH